MSKETFNSQIQIKELSRNSLNEAIELSIRIFNPTLEELQLYHSTEKWLEYFDQSGLALGIYPDGKMIGFTFNYDREIGKGVSHLWLAGIDSEYRGKGSFKLLMDKLLNSLREKNYQSLTVNTNADKFPAMLSYLSKHRFKVQKEEVLADKTKKVYLKRKI